ncbi:MAG: adenylate/guanylate cyclase domain-containing protein [Ilumatobacteraceae bacterium]
MTLREQAVDVAIGSVLFTDLVGFTEYNDAVGDSAAVEVLDEQSRLVAALFEPGSDARVVKELGDGLMFWFADPVQALTVATGLLDCLATARHANRFPLSIRMGMHFGEVVPRGDDFIGHTVNVASRVSDLAGPGELLVSDSVLAATAASGSVQFDPVGPVRIKGVGEPIWLHRLANS